MDREGIIKTKDSRDIEGIITKGVGGAYTIFAEGKSYICNARGIFRNRKTTPLVGDYAIISVTDEDNQKGTLHTIKPRKNQLRRPPVANIDQVIITVATARPAFNAGLLDRFLVLVAHEDIDVLICVNKSDIAKKDDSFSPYIAAGYPLVYTSAIDLHSDGLADLRRHMAGKVNVFAGPSGVGKSSLINALSPKLTLATGDLSTKLGRGKHTTRHSEIFALSENAADGYCVDTPGFSSLETETIPRSRLPVLFREFPPFSDGCRFVDCLHYQERDCAVKEQVGQGISPLRYESYVKILQTTNGASR